MLNTPLLGAGVTPVGRCQLGPIRSTLLRRSLLNAPLSQAVPDGAMTETSHDVMERRTVAMTDLPTLQRG